MGDGSAEFHEAVDVLRPETLDHHRALTSLMEELEAVDWYTQRIDATPDTDLAAILTHNRDEEKEHAAMVLEWLRRRDAALDSALRRYLFSDGSIVGLEDEPAAAAPVHSPSLGIGGLRDREAL